MNISFVGSGNVAQNLAKVFNQLGFNIVEMYAQNYTSLSEFCTIVNANPLKNIAELNTNIDFLVISITDDAIEKVIEEIPKGDFIIAHTSGSVSIEVFSDKDFVNYGVIYPLYSFTKERTEDFTAIPIMLEYSNGFTKERLFNLSERLSNKVLSVNSDDRKLYHLSGVLVNNFTNHLWVMTQELLKKHHLNFDNLKPILKETAENALSVKEISRIQTGPAKRKNKQIILEHIDILEEDRGLQKLYSLMSDLIQERYKENK